MRIYFMPRSNVIIPSCHYAPEFPRCAKLHLISLFMRARLAHTLNGHKEHPLLPREGGGARLSFEGSFQNEYGKRL